MIKMHDEKTKKLAVEAWLNYIPFKVIKIDLGVSQTSIYRWAKEFGVERPKIEKYNSKENK